MKVIYGKRGVKAGFSGIDLKEKILAIADNLRKKGAESIIAGCTEVRIVLGDTDLADLQLITPIDVIAKEAVRRARSKVC